MRKSIICPVLSILVVLLLGQATSIVAARIDLDNQANSTATNGTGSYHLPVFARFSSNGEDIRISSPVFDINLFNCVPRGQPLSARCDRTVSWASFDEFGITSSNLNQLGTLLQLNVVAPTGSIPLEIGSVSMFVIDPNDPNNPIGIGSINTTTGGTFNLSAFGTLPASITPGFYFGFNATFGFNTLGQQTDGGRLTIQSTVAPVPEPATLFLLGTGLAVIVDRKRRKRAK